MCKDLHISLVREYVFSETVSQKNKKIIKNSKMRLFAKSTWIGKMIIVYFSFFFFYSMVYQKCKDLHITLCVCKLSLRTIY